MNDVQRLSPIELCRLLNSTDLGQVMTEQQLRNHRTRGGLRIGGNKISLVRYVAWLVLERHAPKKKPSTEPAKANHLFEAAQGAAAVARRKARKQDEHGQLTRKQELLIAALLTEPSHTAAAAKVGISESTVYRWLQMPGFHAAYRSAQRELLRAAMGRILAASGQAVDTLVSIATEARRDGDRLRAASALIQHSLRGLADAELIHGEPVIEKASPVDASTIVELLATRLEQINRSELSASEKSRLTVTLADALLKAIGFDVIAKRVEALEVVLQGRKHGRSRDASS